MGWEGSDGVFIRVRVVVVIMGVNMSVGYKVRVKVDWWVFKFITGVFVYSRVCCVLKK